MVSQSYNYQLGKSITQLWSRIEWWRYQFRKSIKVLCYAWDVIKHASNGWLEKAISDEVGRENHEDKRDISKAYYDVHLIGER